MENKDCKDESCLEILKEDYEELKKENNLPEFEELNEFFAIEKIASSETDCLSRELRRIISEFLSGEMRLIEAILQPTGSPMFVYSIIKAITINEKNKLAEAYEKLSELAIDIIELDLEFSEEKEIKFIKKSFKEWTKIKHDLLETIKVVKNNWNTKIPTNGKNYFG